MVVWSMMLCLDGYWIIKRSKSNFYRVSPCHVLYGFTIETAFIILRIAILLYGAAQAAINNKCLIARLTVKLT